MAAAAESREGGGLLFVTRCTGVMRDSSDDYTVERKHTIGFSGDDNLELLQDKVSVRRPMYVPGGHHRAPRFSGWRDLEEPDPLRGWKPTDYDSWNAHRGIVVVGGQVKEVKEADGKLYIAVASLKEGNERQYDAVVVASAATEVEWEEPEGADGDTYFAGEADGRRRRDEYTQQDYDNAYSAINEMEQGGCDDSGSEEDEKEFEEGEGPPSKGVPGPIGKED